MGGTNWYEWAFCIPLWWKFHLFLALWWYPKRDWTVILGFLNSELDQRVHWVAVPEEYFVWLMLNHKGIINIPLPYSWGMQCFWDGSVFKGFHADVGHYRTYWWPHGSSFSLFIETILKQEIGVIYAEPQQLNDVISWHDGPIWEICILFKSIHVDFNTDDTGTDVNKALT